MDEITKMKSEAYDILVKIQHLQMLSDEKNKQITQAIEKQRAADSNTKTSRKA